LAKPNPDDLNQNSILMYYNNDEIMPSTSAGGPQSQYSKLYDINGNFTTEERSQSNIGGGHGIDIKQAS
jgi:hypothetical protein